MPFLCPRESRFSKGAFGVLYGAESTATAADEVSYHHTLRLRAAGAPSGTSVILALWSFTVRDDLVDLRAHPDPAIHHPDSYAASQSLGHDLRKQRAGGVIYRSARRPGGECLGVFIPRLIERVEKRDDWRLVWDGATVSEVLRVA